MSPSFFYELSKPHSLLSEADLIEENFYVIHGCSKVHRLIFKKPILGLRIGFLNIGLNKNHAQVSFSEPRLFVSCAHEDDERESM